MGGCWQQSFLVYYQESPGHHPAYFGVSEGDMPVCIYDSSMAHSKESSCMISFPGCMQTCNGNCKYFVVYIFLVTPETVGIPACSSCCVSGSINEFMLVLLPDEILMVSDLRV